LVTPSPTVLVGLDEGVSLHPTDSAVGSGALPHFVGGTFAVVGNLGPAGEDKGVPFAEVSPRRAVQGRLFVDISCAKGYFGVAFMGTRGGIPDGGDGNDCHHQKHDGGDDNGTLHCAYLLSLYN